MDDLTHRFAALLRAELAPNTGLHAKQLAARLGHSRQWIVKILAGEIAIKLRDAVAIAEELPDGAAFLAKLLPAAPAAGLSWHWATRDGAVRRASLGLCAAVRGHLDIPERWPGDLISYAMRNLGWASIEIAGRLVTVEYDDRGFSVAAARAAARWLDDNAGAIDHVRRRVRLVSRTVERMDDDPRAAASTMIRAAELISAGRRAPWRIERLSLDAVPEFKALIRAWHEEPTAIVSAVAALGRLPDCSILRVKEGEVETVEIGSRVAFENKAELVGRNVLDRADITYGEVVHAHMIEAATENAPTVHRLDGVIFGQPWSYLRAALPARAKGIVLSAPIHLPCEDFVAGGLP